MKLLFAFASLFISVTGISQKTDYLVKNNGDTVWGDIKLKNKMFYVTGTTASAIKADDVAKIKSRNYRGNIVVSCNLLTYTDNLAELELDFINKGTIDTVLILGEIYTTPKINLYYVTDNYKTPFYFYKTPSDPKPLQLVIRYYLQGGLANYTDDRAKYRGDKSKVQIAEDKGYVNQLYAIMGDCKKITKPMWELLSYRSYSLKQIIKAYIKCK
jgi:hypothetical protein